MIERAVAAGLERLLVPGWDEASSEAALELAATHPGLVQAAVGIHPHYAAEADERTWERIAALAAGVGCVAVGEIGLDHFRNLPPPAVQAEAFARQLALADRLGKPVIVHDRDAHPDIEASLRAWTGLAGSRFRGVLHAFSGDAAMATRLAKAGFLVSFALPVSFRSASGPREAASALPADRILIETDAPYLGPGPDRRNEPTTVLRVAAELARLRDTSPEAVARNARTAYEGLIGA